MLETMYSDFLVNAKGEQKVKIKKIIKIKELQQKRKLLRYKWRNEENNYNMMNRSKSTYPIWRRRRLYKAV
jgi:hypothetical protein